MKANTLRGQSLATNAFSAIHGLSYLTSPRCACFLPFETRSLRPHRAVITLGSQHLTTKLLWTTGRKASSASTSPGREISDVSEGGLDIKPTVDPPRHSPSGKDDELVKLDANPSINESLREELGASSIYVCFRATRPVIEHLRSEDACRAVSDVLGAHYDSVGSHGLQWISSAVEALRSKYKSIPGIFVQIQWPGEKHLCSEVDFYSAGCFKVYVRRPYSTGAWLYQDYTMFLQLVEFNIRLEPRESVTHRTVRLAPQLTLFFAAKSPAAPGATYELSQTSTTVRQIFEQIVRTSHDFVSQLVGRLLFKDPQHACDMLSEGLLHLLKRHPLLAHATRIRTSLIRRRTSPGSVARTDLCWDDIAIQLASGTVPDGEPNPNRNITAHEDGKKLEHPIEPEVQIDNLTEERHDPQSRRWLEGSNSRGSAVFPDGTYRVISQYGHGGSSRLGPAAGLSTYTYTVSIDSPVTDRSPPFTVASVDAAIEAYLDNAINTGAVSVHGLLTHLKASLPRSANLRLGLNRNDDMVRSPDVTSDVSFRGQTLLNFSWAGDSIVLTERLPTIHGLRLADQSVEVIARLRSRVSPSINPEPIESPFEEVERLSNAIAKFCERHLMTVAIEQVHERSFESATRGFVARYAPLLDNDRYEGFELLIRGTSPSKEGNRRLSASVDLIRLRKHLVSNAEAQQSIAEVQDEVDGERSWNVDAPLYADQNTKGGVFIALGSNVGDRLQAIEDACRAIDAGRDMRIIRTSSLYETEPMYVENQDRFLNGVCEVETSLEPLELLDRLQAIEQHLGRVKLIDKGPRNIDLDILLYRDRRVSSERLTIPHPLMMEREFVLRPLTDIVGGYLPALGQSVRSLLNARFPVPASTIFPHLPLGPPGVYLRAGDPERRTMVMSILNTTPDSFSDGGTNEPYDIAALKSTVARHIAEGATIVDIGGQSSRPNAPDITAEEEIARVLPAIKAIQSLPEAANVTISVDTYRAAVAEAAVAAGAHVINDISGGLLDPEMLPTIANLGCTYVMMHMRGNPHTMQNEENTTYVNGILHGVRSELEDRIIAAQEAGIRRWRLILDPGIGFAKTLDQNVELLSALPVLVRSARLLNIPWLVGTSRKGFIGKVTGVALAKDRTWGTAATVTAAVRGGADIVRVHDVKEMAEVTKMSDAIFRRRINREAQT